SESPYLNTSKEAFLGQPYFRSESDNWKNPIAPDGLECTGGYFKCVICCLSSASKSTPLLRAIRTNSNSWAPISSLVTSILIWVASGWLPSGLLGWREARSIILAAAANAGNPGGKSYVDERSVDVFGASLTFSACLICSQFFSTSSTDTAPRRSLGSSWPCESNTCGLRRTIFWLMASATSSILNTPACAAIAECKVTWNNTSPSSLRNSSYIPASWASSSHR